MACGKPFTAKDVQCTWDLLLEKSSDKLRVNPLNPHSPDEAAILSAFAAALR
jgi:ABC-type transport system substrate-binding protein